MSEDFFIGSSEEGSDQEGSTDLEHTLEAVLHYLENEAGQFNKRCVDEALDAQLRAGNFGQIPGRALYLNPHILVKPKRCAAKKGQIPGRALTFNPHILVKP